MEEKFDEIIEKQIRTITESLAYMIEELVEYKSIIMSMQQLIYIKNNYKNK